MKFFNKINFFFKFSHLNFKFFPLWILVFFIAQYNNIETAIAEINDKNNVYNFSNNINEIFSRNGFVDIFSRPAVVEINDKNIVVDNLSNNKSFSGNNFGDIFSNSVNDVFNIFVIYFIITFSIVCFYNLINAVSTVRALMSFFGVLVSFVFFFFSVKADYVGSIILMVYLGAIIIFFCFILLTMNPADFSRSFNENFVFINKANFIIFSAAYFYVFYISLKEVISDQLSISQIMLAEKIDFWSNFSNTNTNISSIGYILYTHYFILVNILGVILFIALIGSLNLINPNMDRKVFIFKKKNRNFKGVNGFKKIKKLHLIWLVSRW